MILTLHRIISYLYPKAYKRHIGVTHCYYMSQLFVEGTHFSRPLWLLWLWVPVFPRYLQDGNKMFTFLIAAAFT